MVPRQQAGVRRRYKDGLHLRQLLACNTSYAASTGVKRASVSIKCSYKILTVKVPYECPRLVNQSDHFSARRTSMGSCCFQGKKPAGSTDGFESSTNGFGALVLILQFHDCLSGTCSSGNFVFMETSDRKLFESQVRNGFSQALDQVHLIRSAQLRSNGRIDFVFVK